METPRPNQPEQHDDSDSIDLLISAATAGIGTPDGLASRIDRKIAGLRRRHRIVMSSCASVLLVVIAGVVVMRFGESSSNEGASNRDIAGNHDRPPEVFDAPVQDIAPLPPAAERVRVRLASHEQFITVPTPTGNPNITIIQIYRAVPVAKSDNDAPVDESEESAGEPNTRSTDHYKEFIG